MKKKIFGGMVVLAVMATVTFNVNLNTQKENASLLALNNIEAFAAGEIGYINTQDYLKGSYWCCGSGRGICSASVNCSSI